MYEFTKRFGLDYYKSGDQWKQQFPRKLLARLHIRWAVINILTFKNWLTIYIRKGPYRLVTRTGAMFETSHKERDLQVIPYIFYFKEYGDLSGLPKNATVIDLGGHVGSFSISVLKENPSSRVFTYEPSPTNFSALKKNIALNKLEDRCTLFQKAVAGTDETRTLYMTEKSAADTIYKYGDRKQEQAVSVECTTLESIFKSNQIGVCDLMKVDIEGAEFETIAAAPASVLSRINKMILEWHLKDGKHGEKDILDLLTEKGFIVQADFPSRNLITAVRRP